MTNIYNVLDGFTFVSLNGLDSVISGLPSIFLDFLVFLLFPYSHKFIIRQGTIIIEHLLEQKIKKSHGIIIFSYG